MPQDTGMAKRDTINPESLTPEQLLKLLGAAGSSATAQDVRAALHAGAPQENGRIHIVKFTQWLLRESPA